MTSAARSQHDPHEPRVAYAAASDHGAVARGETQAPWEDLTARDWVIVTSAKDTDHYSLIQLGGLVRSDRVQRDEVLRHLPSGREFRAADVPHLRDHFPNEVDAGLASAIELPSPADMATESHLLPANTATPGALPARRPLTGSSLDGAPRASLGHVIAVLCMAATLGLVLAAIVGWIPMTSEAARSRTAGDIDRPPGS